MNFDSYSGKRGLFRMLGGVGLIVTPLLVVLYMGPHSLPAVQAGPALAPTASSSMPSPEQFTRAILLRDLDESWAHYESGEYNEAMWTKAHAHIVRLWKRQADGKGWSALGWTPPERDETNPPLSAASRRD